MNTPDVAITAVTAAYLATLGAGTALMLRIGGRLRLGAPPRQPQAPAAPPPDQGGAT